MGGDGPHLPRGRAEQDAGDLEPAHRRAAASGLRPRQRLVALGGGVAGDLAGFVAATYMRGIPFIQVPTTLLAMLDASVGGKTGVDTPEGKNLIGAFHPPVAVVADPLVLATLPDREYRAGLAEAVKHGLIADREYFELDREQGGRARRGGIPTTLEHLVRRSVEIKADVVGEDEREAGRRAILNAGHTVGARAGAGDRISGCRTARPWASASWRRRHWRRDSGSQRPRRARGWRRCSSGSACPPACASRWRRAHHRRDGERQEESGGGDPFRAAPRPGDDGSGTRVDHRGRGAGDQGCPSGNFIRPSTATVALSTLGRGRGKSGRRVDKATNRLSTNIL